MPELPDVEVFRRYIATTSLHQTVERVVVEADKSRKVLVDLSPADLEEAVRGESFEETSRHGKYCFIRLSSGRFLALHFGMTGFPRYFKQPPADLDHIRVRFFFDNEYQLVFVNQRLLGRIRLIGEPGNLIENRNLGPDALNDLTEDAFSRRVADSRAQIKGLLTDQEKVAGIGNIYGDEILFQARIHPAAKANRLDEDQRHQLFRCLRSVLHQAVEAGAEVDRMPAGYLLSQRREGERCPRCGMDIEKKKIQGRGTYFCPACQRKPSG